jgi:hypothetical protein
MKIRQGKNRLNMLICNYNAHKQGYTDSANSSFSALSYRRSLLFLRQTPWSDISISLQYSALQSEGEPKREGLP